MICLVYDGYGASTTTLVFITCIWVPFLQAKHVFFEILSTLMMIFPQHDHYHQLHDDNDHHHHDDHHHGNLWKIISNAYNLSTLQFRDIAIEDSGTTRREVDDTCSICLAEFKDEDAVSQLNRCCHVFHTCCIERWLTRDNFTCPLCRSNLLHLG
ncbi:RING-H2 finger protein ATL18-like [Lactuca sativa]|uniref:RING-H2 finger protein ATL18-like n=1 Tax=Lactuca sativa TaxID=4236 RepID=UPI000CD9AF98|nr:RING-H2 finger protein ATL18-like [Lactuca sativa]